MVGSDRVQPGPTSQPIEEHTMIEDYELYLASPGARPNWIKRLLASFRSRRTAAAPTSAHLRRDIGLGEDPIGRRLG
jgi:hypothetical protein